jgi:hypothetical protein
VIINMSDNENRFNPEPPENENDISMIYAHNTPKDFIVYLSRLDKHSELILRLHAATVDIGSINYLMTNFSRARVEVTADPESKARLEKELYIGVDWKEEK